MEAFIGQNWNLEGLTFNGAEKKRERTKLKKLSDFCRKYQDCKICGKRFLAGPEYVYKRDIWNQKKRMGIMVYYCSYGHYRQDENNKAAQKKEQIERELSGLYYTANGDPITTQKQDTADDEVSKDKTEVA